KGRHFVRLKFDALDIDPSAARPRSAQPARGRPSTPSELSNHDCLIYSGRSGTDWKFRSGARWISFRPSGRPRADSGEMLVEWAMAGLGIADVPTFLLADHIDSGALEPVLLDYSTEDYGM